MAQIIHLNGPTTADYVSHFADQYAQSLRGRQAMDVENRRLGIEQQRADADRTFNEGQLGLAKGKFEDEQKNAYYANFIKTAIDPYMDGTPDGQATAKKNLDAELARNPQAANELRAYALRLSNQLTMADRTKANVGKFAETQAGIAAGGGTDPNAVNFATHQATGAFMPSEGFTQQQATDLQARGGGSEDQIPKPTGNSVTDYERRATLAMPTAPQNQASQTQIKTTAMGEAGATKRTAMTLASQERQANPPLGALGAPSVDGSKASPFVRALVERKADPKLLQGIARRPNGLALLNQIEAQAQAIDPNFSMAEYPKQVANLKEYSQAGRTGTSITAGNQAIHHLDSFLNDLAKMDNTRFEWWNAAANPVARAAGNEGVQKSTAQLNKDRSAVSKELAKFFHGSAQFGEKEAADWERDLGPNTTPASGLGAASAAIKLIAGRANEIRESHKRDTGLDAPDFLKGVRPILAKFKKMGVEGVDELFGGSAQTSNSDGGASPGEAWARKHMGQQ